MKPHDIEPIVGKLGYDFEHFDMADFIRHVERLRRREIMLLPFPFQLELSALWIRGQTVDYIFYNNHLHDIHKTHSILHEIAHLILGHTGRPIDQILPPELLMQLHLADLQGRMRTAVLLRDDPEEQEAEAFAFAIQKRLVAARRIVEVMGQSSSIEALRRQVDSMGFDA